MFRLLFCFVLLIFFFFFFKQKTAYEMRISDWSSDVCSSDLHAGIGTRLCPFGNDIGIEQEAHSAVSRTPPSSRSTVSPEPRSGAARRKSAKLPIISRRCVFSQSSASTPTTALLPLRVTPCGPLRRRSEERRGGRGGVST